MRILFIKCIAIIIICIFVANCKIKDPNKKRVILIGIDGLFENCLNQTDNTIFNYMKKQGSSTLVARTIIETLSASGWSSILCGMDTEDTGITNNQWFAPWMYGGKKDDITPITGLDNPLPCVFGELKKNKKDINIKVTYDWNWFLNFGNSSIPGSIDKEDYCEVMPDDQIQSYIKCDNQMLNNAITNIKEDFDFMFVYFGSVDESGHMFGFCSEKYIERLSSINKNIEIIFEELKENRIFNNTYIILTTDHGAEAGTNWHGEWDDLNILIPWYIIGPGIKKNHVINKKVINGDTSPTILKIFGYNPNPLWRGRILEEVFENNNQ